MMKTSEAGVTAIIQREGERLHAYKDTVGVLTIGVGHTSAAGSPHVFPGMTITKAESRRILIADLAAVEKDVNDLVMVPLNQHQFDALVSFVFNIGRTAFAKSTLLRKLNAKDYRGAADQFLMWVKQKELTGRRKQERAQFLS